MALPAGVYTAHASTALAVNIVTPDTGDQYGTDTDNVGVNPSFELIAIPTTIEGVVANTDAIPQTTSITDLLGLSTNPAGVYTSHSMTTMGLNVISPDTGFQYSSILPHEFVVRYTSGIINAFSVIGEIDPTFSMPQPQGFDVVGQISLSFTRVAGTVALFGSFSCKGNINVQFTPPANKTFTVEGEIVVNIFPSEGQPLTCIAGPEEIALVPVSGEEDYVF